MGQTNEGQPVRHGSAGGTGNVTPRRRRRVVPLTPEEIHCRLFLLGIAFTAGPAAVATYKAADRRGLTALQKGAHRAGAGGVRGMKTWF